MKIKILFFCLMSYGLYSNDDQRKIEGSCNAIRWARIEDDADREQIILQYHDGYQSSYRHIKHENRYSCDTCDMSSDNDFICISRRCNMKSSDNDFARAKFIAQAFLARDEGR